MQYARKGKKPTFPHNISTIQSITPQTTLVTVPYIITGPAMVNILAPTPKIYPSAAVNIEHSDFENIYNKSALWYNILC